MLRGGFLPVCKGSSSSRRITLPLKSRTSHVYPIIAAFLLLAAPQTGHAQKLGGGANATAGEEIANAYNGAMASFQKADWAGASAKFEQVIAMVMQLDVKTQGQLAPVYYALGSSYFNQPDFKKAIEAFKKYLDKFPNGERATDVKLGLAKASYEMRDFPTALKIFAQFETTPALRDDVLLFEALCYKGMGKPHQEIAVLEKLVSADIKTTLQARGGIRLVELYTDLGDSDKAVALLSKLYRKAALIENQISLNELAVRLGDELSDKSKFAQAIQAYRSVRTRDEIVAFQKDRINRMEKLMEANLKSVVGNPVAYIQVTQRNNEIKAYEADAKELLTDFEKLPDFMPTVLLRAARCWYDWDKKWYAIVVYKHVYDNYTDPVAREPALFAMVETYAELMQVAHCQQLCHQYVKDFPEGPNASTVGYISGAVALQAQDPKSAEAQFTEMLAKVPNGPFTEKIRYLLGVSKFMQGNYAGAHEDFEQYLKEFPNGDTLEEVHYRNALCLVFGGKYDEGKAALQAFQSHYSSSAFISDCKYRIIVCDYAAQRYEAVIRGADAWRKQYPEDKLRGEVAAILGDSLAATGKEAECIPAYIDSYKAAPTDEVLNYSLFEASKHLQKLGKWPELAKMFEDFVKEKPDATAVVAASYWIGRAKAKQGKTEEAKRFLVDTLKKYVGQPRREAVEQLLQQLAQLCAKRPRPVIAQTAPEPPKAEGATDGKPAAGAPAGSAKPPQPAPVIAASSPAKPAATAPAATATGGAPTPPVPSDAAKAPDAAVAEAEPEPPPYDPEAELQTQLKPFEQDANATTRARMLYARSELAKIRKMDDEVERIYERLAGEFKPEELSPVLLALVGDFIFEKRQTDKATTYYTLLKEEFPKSDYEDFAYVGLGEIAFRAKKFQQAVELYTAAVDEFTGIKIKEATIGKARSLLELGRYDEAKKLFEQVAGVREWRGESTAGALYWLGEVEARQSHWAEAISHYQRIYVAYQKYAHWVAKAYIKSAEAFDKMGKRQEAAASLREMLRNERLTALPEAEEAKKLLQSWGGTV